MRQDDAPSGDIEAFRTNEFFGKIMGVSLALTCLIRLAVQARRRVSSGRTDSVRNGIYQDRLVTQLD
jgi:hypothetical protein